MPATWKWCWVCCADCAGVGSGSAASKGFQLIGDVRHVAVFRVPRPGGQVAAVDKLCQRHWLVVPRPGGDMYVGAGTSCHPVQQWQTGRFEAGCDTPLFCGLPVCVEQRVDQDSFRAVLLRQQLSVVTIKAISSTVAALA